MQIKLLILIRGGESGGENGIQIKLQKKWFTNCWLFLFVIFEFDVAKK